jgi:hypothetical protein
MKIYPRFFKIIMLNYARKISEVKNYCGEYVIRPLVTEELSYL